MIKEFIYKVLDIITSGKGITRTFNGNKVKLITRYFRYFPKGYEDENLRIANEKLKPGMCVVDVGAHFGLISCIFGNKVKPEGLVYAFEPTPSTFQLLNKTIALNKLKGIVVPVEAALSYQSGETHFFISDNNADNSNSLVNNKRIDRKEQSIKVRLFSLDDFAEERKVKKIDFIKIDAEGAELQVLKGGIRTLEKHRPSIILAVHPEPIRNFGDSLDEIWQFVRQVGYKVTLDSKEMSKEEFVSKQDLFDVFLVFEK